MPWNWELPLWPQFTYEPQRISQQERQFLLGSGSEWAFLKNITEQEYDQFIVEILSVEGMESSRIGLVEKGTLIKTGELRHTRYSLNLSKRT